MARDQRRRPAAAASPSEKSCPRDREDRLLSDLSREGAPGLQSRRRVAQSREINGRDMRPFWGKVKERCKKARSPPPRLHYGSCVLRQAQDEVFSRWHLADARLDFPHPEPVEGRKMVLPRRLGHAHWGIAEDKAGARIA